MSANVFLELGANVNNKYKKISEEKILDLVWGGGGGAYHVSVSTS